MSANGAVCEPVSLFYVTHLLDTIQLVDLRVHDLIFQSLPRNLFCKEAVPSSSDASPRTSFPLKVFQSFKGMFHYISELRISCFGVVF